MRIQNIPSFKLYAAQNPQNPQKQETISPQTTPIQPRNAFAYQDYNISFGARRNFTPENFVAQDFNAKNMPDTMKEYLQEDFETRKMIHPTELQRQAFEWIEAADTVEDVKSSYPDEKLFKDLKSFKESNARRGYLYELRVMSNGGKDSLFKNESKTDLSVYLLKKIYLEGQTLEEINKNLSKEIKPEFKSEDGFTYKDLKSLGVKFPNTSYWKSFLATRDREYVPKTKNQNIYNDLAPKKRAVSEETRDKLSEAKTKWWAGLGDIERDDLINKMCEGRKASEDSKEKSVLIQNMGPIRTIACYLCGYGDKLSEKFAEKMADPKFMEKYTDKDERLGAIMNSFWNEGSEEFRAEYTKAIKSVTEEFLNAYDKGEDSPELKAFYEKAITFKEKVIEKARLRSFERAEKKKEAELLKGIVFDSQQQLKNAFMESVNTETKFFADDYSRTYTSFIRGRKIEAPIMQLALIINNKKEGLLGKSEEEIDAVKMYINEELYKVNQEFDDKHPFEYKANEFAVNKVLYKITGDPDVFKNTRADALLFIEDNGLKDAVLANKTSMNADYANYMHKMNDETANKLFTNTFLPEIKKAARYGFKHHDDMPLEVAQKIIALGLKQDNFTMTFIKSNKGAFKFIQDKSQPQKARDLVLEHIAYDYIYEKAKRIKKQGSII